MRGATGLVNIHHFCFTVMDLKRTVEFYTNVVGLELRSMTHYEYEGYGQSLFGTDWREHLDGDAVLDIAVLELNGVRIEFNQYLNPLSAPYHCDPSRAGSAHLGIKVQDIDKVRRRLEDYGVEFHSPMAIFNESQHRPWRWCHFRDPDGIIIELVEETPVNFQLEQMGERLRETRLSRGLTLKNVASGSDISAAHLSQIERGETAPSVAALLGISAALGVGPDFFFRPSPSEDAWTSPMCTNGETPESAEAPGLQLDGDGHADGVFDSLKVIGSAHQRWLTARNAPIQLVRVRFDEGAEVRVEPFSKQGVESALLSEGTLLVEIGQNSHVLTPGSTYSCDRLGERRFVNIGETPAIGVWAIVAS